MFGRFEERRVRNLENRPPSSRTVYVVVFIDRQRVRPASLVDNQTDIEVLAVFSTRRAADAFIDARDPTQRRFRHYMIHEVAMNPDSLSDRSGIGDWGTFRPEI
jgi:hypothetical protein